MESVVSRESALRLSYMGVCGLLFVGTNAVWNSLGNISPLAWGLEWSSIILAFLCVFSAVKTSGFSQHIYGYTLIGISVSIAVISYAISATQAPVSAATGESFNSYYLAILAAPVIVLAFLIRSDLKNRSSERSIPLLFFLLLLAAVGFILYLYYSYAPSFPTDESVFDMFAAHLLLIGKNPYNPSLMSGAFSYYGFHFGAFDPITPMRTGGYVDRLTYPALSFLIFIPALLLKVKAATIMLPILLIPAIIIWYRAWSAKQWIVSSYALIPFLSLLIYTYQGASADTDALWASLLMLSYVSLPRSGISGLLFGLSLSVKQLPVLVLPFFLYFVYREFGTKEMIKWLLAALITFIAVNGYFILLNPGYWFTSMLENEFAPLIGIGFGVPQIAFTGILQLPNIYFTIIMADLLILLFMVYVIRYGEIKYALFAFPILIFLFNYRLFPQYLYYWMIISILPAIDLIIRPGNADERQQPAARGPWKSSPGIKKWVAVLIIIVLAGSLALGYHEGVQKSEGYFKIESVNFSSYNSSGYVKEMTVEITYEGPLKYIPDVYFRIFQSGPIANGNMFLWQTSNHALLDQGSVTNLTIFPQYQEYSINPDISSMIVAYYGNVQGSFHLA